MISQEETKPGVGHRSVPFSTYEGWYHNPVIIHEWSLLHVASNKAQCNCHNGQAEKSATKCSNSVSGCRARS